MADCVLQCLNARRAVNFGKKLTAVDHIILRRSDPLVHTEFQFSGRGNYESFSATMQEGCRFKRIAYSHPQRWTSLILPMTDEQEYRAWDKAIEIEGSPYDLVGLGSFGTSWNIIKPDPDKYWCSESDGELIKAAYQYGKDFIPHFYHPVGLFFEMYHRLAVS